MKIKESIKNIYLWLRCILFNMCFVFTFTMRRKTFSETTIKKIMVIGLTRIGDNIASIPTFKAIKEHYRGAELVVLTNNYNKDMLEDVGLIDRIVILKRNSLLAKIKLIKRLRAESFDLSVDLTCDYTFIPTLWTYLSKAKYRVGYNIYGRGFLFNKAVKHSKGHMHVIDEILNIVRSIGLDTQNKQPRISVSPKAGEIVRQFLAQRDVGGNDLLVGIQPGGHYPTQCWLKDRFAAVADKITEKYKARVVLIGSVKEAGLINQLKNNMINEPIFFLNQPLKNLIALIQRCQLLIGNNSGPIHIATAVGTPTVSTMGPTIPGRWLPYGENHIIICKDLPCMPCNNGYCKLKTHDCMKLIRVEDVLNAVEIQLSKILKQRSTISSEA